jgi:hypothetical protein
MLGQVVVCLLVGTAFGLFSESKRREWTSSDPPVAHAGCHSAKPAYGPESNFSVPVVLSQAQTLVKVSVVAVGLDVGPVLLWLFYA